MASALQRTPSKKAFQSLLRLTAQRTVEDEEEVARERRRRERQERSRGEGDEERGGHDGGGHGVGGHGAAAPGAVETASRSRSQAAEPPCPISGRKGRSVASSNDDDDEGFSERRRRERETRSEPGGGDEVTAGTRSAASSVWTSLSSTVSSSTSVAARAREQRDDTTGSKEEEKEREMEKSERKEREEREEKERKDRKEREDREQRDREEEAEAAAEAARKKKKRESEETEQRERTERGSREKKLSSSGGGGGVGEDGATGDARGRMSQPATGRVGSVSASDAGGRERASVVDASARSRDPPPPPTAASPHKAPVEADTPGGRSSRASRSSRGSASFDDSDIPTPGAAAAGDDESPGGFAPRGHGVTRSFRTPSRKGADLEELVEPEALVAISDRAEFLNKTVQRSYSLKSPRPIAKIDTKVYTSAVESAGRAAGRVVRPIVVEVPLPADSVALRKSQFERGDVAQPTSPRGGSSTREVTGLNVGIASRISQWSNKNEEGAAKGGAARPSDIRPGDVSTKKSIWESKPSAAGGAAEKPAPATGKGNPSGKRSKFVMVSPGKYEKVPIGSNHFANGGGSEHDESEQ